MPKSVSRARSGIRAVFREEDVRRFDITVDDAAPVDVVEPLRQVVTDLGDVPRRHRIPVESLTQVDAVHELHHKEDLRVVRLGPVHTDVEQGDNAVVVQACQHVDLGLLALNIGHVGGAKFEILIATSRPRRSSVAR